MKDSEAMILQFPLKDGGKVVIEKNFRWEGRPDLTGCVVSLMTPDPDSKKVISFQICRRIDGVNRIQMDTRHTSVNIGTLKFIREIKDLSVKGPGFVNPKDEITIITLGISGLV